MKRLAALAAASFSAACVSTPDATIINAPAEAAASTAFETNLNADGDALMLAFSGGGARAASFSFGALTALHDMHDAGGAPLTQRIALITSVSGGSITAAYYGLHGDDGLASFRADALDKDWAADLRTSALSPANWLRALGGGINGRDRLSDWLDREVFRGATLADFDRPGAPRIVLNATELYNGVPFAFAPPFFQAICGDLADVPAADAVAASMSVPIAFRATTIATHANCAPLPDWVAQSASGREGSVIVRETARAFELYRDPARMGFLHLVDGGVVDNFGLASLLVLRAAAQTPYGPFSARDAVRLSHVTVVVIDAGIAPQGDWPLREAGPDGAQTAAAVLDAQINAGKRGAYDAFAGMLDRWQGDVVTYRCGLSNEDVLALRGALDGWDCRDFRFTLDLVSFSDLDAARAARFGAAPTAVSLDPDLVTALIQGGHDAILENAAVRAIGR